MKNLVVSIVSYNTADALARCLRHVLASEFPEPVDVEVVVVDNYPGDGSAEVVQEFSEVRLLEPGRNLFYTGGNNLAWASTESRYFLILNPDCYVEPDSLAISMSYLDNHPEVAGVTLRMAFEDGEEQRNCARFQDRWYSLLWYTALGGAFPSWRTRAQRRVFYEDWDRSTTRPVDVAPGSYLMVRRAALPEGLFDESMALYFVEDDLSRRLAGNQWRIDFVAEGRVIHPERTSTDREPPQRIRRIFFEDLHAYYRKFEPGWYVNLLWAGIRASDGLRWALQRRWRPAGQSA